MADPVTITLSSAMTSGELDYLFRTVTHSMASRAGALRGNKMTYFEPTSTVAKPDNEISVGAKIPTLSGWHGGEVTIHLYVRDAGHEREIRLYVPYSFGGRRAAVKALDRVRTGMKL